MKKKFYLLLLTFVLMPFAVKAEVNLEEAHDSISKENEITIKTVPIEKYKETKYFNDCLKRDYYNPDLDNPEEICINEIYASIVSSKIKKSVDIPSNIHMFVGGCNIKENTCKVNLYIGQKQLLEIYKIKVEEVKDEKIFNQTEKMLSKIKNDYKLEDMGYINQLINFQGIKGFFNELQSSTKIFKMYPEIKENMEANKNIEYVSVFNGGGGSPTSYGAVGDIIAYNNDTAVGIANIGYHTNRLIYIPDTTEKTKEAYIKAALERIKKYINNDSYEIKIEFDEQMTTDLCTPEVKECDFTDVFKKGDKYSMELYKLTINDDEQTLGIMPVPEKEIRKIDVKSKDHSTGVNIETNSSDVPLDTSVESKDVTDKHQKHDIKKAYDINLFSDLNGKYIKEVKDGIIVRIPVEDDYNNEKTTVVHIKEDGTKGDKYEAKIEEIDGKKYVTFTTNHFSTYAIEEIKETLKEEVPNTFDGIRSNIVVLIISLIGILSTLVYLKKYKKSNN